MWSFDNRNHKLELIGAETVSPIFCQILRISWQRSYSNATRTLGDVTAMSQGTWRAPSDPMARLLRCYGDLFLRRPHCACFEHVKNFAATSVTLEILLRSAALPWHSLRSHNVPAAISRDLADFADRSEVAILCDWGIRNTCFIDVNNSSHIKRWAKWPSYGSTQRQLMTGNFYILIKLSLKYDPINNKSTFVQITNWHQ